MYPKRNFGALGKVAVVGGAPAVSDFHRWMHPEIAIASAPMPLNQLTPQGLEKMGERLSDVFQLFKTYDPCDLAFFSCTSGSLIGGRGYDEKICRLCRDASGSREAYTTTTAVLHALKSLNAKKISIVTPYPDDVNQAEKVFFEDNGYIVRNIEGIATEDPRNPKLISQIPPEIIYEFAMTHMDAQADALFLSCTGLMVLELIAELENRLCVPVITSNQAAIWMMGQFFGAHSDHAKQKLGVLLKTSCAGRGRRP